MPKKRNLPKNVSEFMYRGRWRLRYRKKGQASYYFKSRPGTVEFAKELQQCRTGELTAYKRSGMRTKPGSISALIAVYYSTPEFLGLKDSTKVTYRGILERFRERFGARDVKTLSKQNVRTIISRMQDRKTAANKLLERLRVLLDLAVDEGWRDDNPAARVKGFKIKSDGFYAWTEDDIAQFEQYYPVGTKARLALSLMLYLGQRRSDVVSLGHQHIKNGYMCFRQVKTGARLEIPIHSELHQAINAMPRSQLPFLVTEYGKAFSVAGFGNWMRKRCDEAGLYQCSSHGLRKAAARRMAEAGASNQLIKSITGHKTDKEVSRYTESADQKRRADQALSTLSKPNSERKNGSH